MRQQTGSRGFMGVLFVGILLVGVLAALPAQAASSNGPYYAEPSWAQKLPPATRFVVLLDWNSEAVLDRETGLVWEKTPDIGVHAWDNNAALFVCANKIVGGRKGWRLPSLPELASLVDPSVASPGPTLPAGHPFTTGTITGVQSAIYWSASTFAFSTPGAWHVGFSNGNVSISNKTLSFHVWCVRGGMNADQY